MHDIATASPYLVILMYGIAVANLLRTANKNEPTEHAFNRLMILAGFLLHAYTLYLLIDTHQGQNLSIANMFSLLCWLALGVIFSASLWLKVINLTIFTLPLCMISILVAEFSDSQNIINTNQSASQLVHILLAITAYSLMTIAAIQALIMAGQEKIMQRRPLSRVLKFLPAILTMETLLFGFIWFGFILLSLALVTGWYFVEHSIVQMSFKSILSLLSWAFFLSLLWGRYQFGWRGKTAVYWTLTGYFTLLIAYCCSTILL